MEAEKVRTSSLVVVELKWDANGQYPFFSEKDFDAAVGQVAAAISERAISRWCREFESKIEKFRDATHTETYRLANWLTDQGQQIARLYRDVQDLTRKLNDLSAKSKRVPGRAKKRKAVAGSNRPCVKRRGRAAAKAHRGKGRKAR